MPFLFEKLNVYRRALDLADGLASRATGFSRGQFFGIARGSAHECVALLELARRRSLVTDEDHAALYSEIDEICRMINGLIRGIPRRKAP
jgi:four helix bundle protein